MLGLEACLLQGEFDVALLSSPLLLHASMACKAACTPNGEMTFNSSVATA
jgi:hypothetical protein